MAPIEDMRRDMRKAIGISSSRNSCSRGLRFGGIVVKAPKMEASQEIEKIQRYLTIAVASINQYQKRRF